MMTRQHFQFIADTLKEALQAEAELIQAARDAGKDSTYPSVISAQDRRVSIANVAHRFARELHRTNSRFDEARFLKACGVA